MNSIATAVATELAGSNPALSSLGAFFTLRGHLPDADAHATTIADDYGKRKSALAT